jgi:spermidine/putrescine transport system substrate-binding protein
MTQRRRPPMSPEVAAIVRAQLSSGRSISRRSLLGGAGAMGLAGFLAACGTSGTSSSSGTPTAAAAVKDTSKTDKIVNWANWPLYLDYDDKKKVYPTLQKFQQINGIKATYSEDIDDNESYYAKIQGQLKNGQDIGKDIVVFTDWMAARVIKQGYVQKLDKTVIPNSKNLLTGLQNVDFDPGRNYSLTWQSGFTGLAWNKKAFPEGLRNVSDLWQPKLKGKVEVLSEMRDTIGLIMLEQGVDVSTSWTSDAFGNAIDVLKKQLDSGQIRQVKGNSYAKDLANGDALAVMGWSGDVVSLDPEKFGFALPDAGGMLWSDNMLIPIASPHRENAEILMNYYYDPDVAAQVAAYVNYVCPVDGAKEAMQKLDPSLVDNQLIFPNTETLAKAHVFRSLTAAEQTEFSSQFEAALGN